MTSLLSALAVSAITHIIPPNVTLTLSQTSGAMLVAVSGADLAQAALDTPSSYLYALPAQDLSEVERGLQLRSPVDLALYAAPLGALVWNSSPALRAAAHEAGALIHQISAAIRNVISRLLVRHASPSGSIPPSTFVSAPGFSLDGHLNYSSIINESSRPVFGPEWEWYPRDLVVFVPQPSCPVPVLRSDVSTLPTLDRCGLESQGYYADIIRSAMRGKSSIDSRFDWCGRGSEGLEEELKHAVLIRRELSRKEVARRHKLVIEDARQHELAQLASVYECKGAWRPLALCFAALMIVYGLLTYIDISDLHEEKENVFHEPESLAPANPTGNSARRQPQYLHIPLPPQPLVEPSSFCALLSPPCIDPSPPCVDISLPRVDSFPPAPPGPPHHEPKTVVEYLPAGTSHCTGDAEATKDSLLLGLEEVDRASCKEDDKPQDEWLDLPPLPPSPPFSPRTSLAPTPEHLEPELDTVAAALLPKPFSWADDAEELEQREREQRDQARREELERKEEQREREALEQRGREERECQERAREEKERGEKECIDKAREEKERSMKKQAQKKREDEWRRELELSLAEKERAEALRVATLEARWKAMGGGAGWVASLSKGKPSTSADDGTAFETVVRRKKGRGSNQGGGGGGGSRKGVACEVGMNGAGRLCPSTSATRHA